MRKIATSLKHSQRRRKLIEDRLASLVLEYEVVNVIDSRELSWSELIIFTNKIIYAIECGETGCSLSHILIYVKMIAGNVSSSLILEDDTFLSDDLPIVLDKVKSNTT